MQRRRACAVLVVAALALGGGLPGAGAQGPPDEEYGRLLSRLDQTRRRVAEAEARERAIRRDIAATGARRDALVEELEELTAQLEGARGRLDRAEAVLGRIQQQLAAKTQELEGALWALQAAHERLRARAVQVYKAGPASLLAFLVGAVDFRDLANRVRFVVSVFRSDDRRIEELTQAKARIERERAEVAALRQQAQEQVATIERERARVAGLHRAVESRRQALEEELRRKRLSLQEVQREKEVWLRQQRELEEESRRIAAFLRSRSGGKATVAPGGMAWPTAGPVTSGFGWRTHPIFGTRKFHTGIDIGAPVGQAVVAAAAGTVIFAGPKGGYGNTVIIDHGGGLATLYAHLSAVSAGPGTAVSRGRTVGLVGCTGYCTGPHLHFEVRVNGEPQDPMRWLS